MSDSVIKDKIMSAVRELLSEGCKAKDITVRKIAQRAGVGIGTVSYHFHSKDKLVYEAVGGMMTELARSLSPSEEAGPPFERLRRFFYQTAELALQYNESFRIQLCYEIVHGDLSICYYITPLLKEHFGEAKSDLEIKLIALQMIAAMQITLIKMEEFQRYSGINIWDAKQRQKALDIILNTAIKS